MRRDYFERLHRQEGRYAEWRMLDRALVERSGTQKRPWNRVQVALGTQMVRVGKHLLASAQARDVSHSQ